MCSAAVLRVLMGDCARRFALQAPGDLAARERAPPSSWLTAHLMQTLTHTYYTLVRIITNILANYSCALLNLNLLGSTRNKNKFHQNNRWCICAKHLCTPLCLEGAKLSCIGLKLLCSNSLRRKLELRCFDSEVWEYPARCPNCCVLKFSYCENTILTLRCIIICIVIYHFHGLGGTIRAHIHRFGNQV